MTVGPCFFSQAVPILISGSLKAAAVNNAYNSPALTLTNADGGGTWSLGAGAPSWLTVNATTGVYSGAGPTIYAIGISGTLRAAAPGTTYYSPALTLRDASGGGTWSLGAGAPSWLTINPTTGVYGGSTP